MIGKEEKIIAGAREIFRKEGIKALTMDEIAKQLHVSKKTLYVFFRNREMLLKRCVEDFIEEDITTVDEILENTEDAIGTFCAISFRRVQSLSGMNQKYYKDLVTHYPEQLMLFNEHIWTNLASRYESIIDRGMKENLFRSDLNPKLVAKLYLKKGITILDTNYFPADKYDTIEVFMTDLDLFLRGLSSDKGLESLEKHKYNLKEKVANIA
jgi:TetR/AcrR family transcriptional regulator, cholesterol catabolism regulator